MVIISDHAKKRMKERCGLPKKSLQRMADKAFTEGIKHSETKSLLREWVTSLYFKNQSANNIRLYGGNAYIFCDEVLVTVLPIPYSLRKEIPNMLKKELRRKYD